MSSRKMPLLREAARNLGTTEEVFSNKMLYAALGADSEADKDRIRTQASALVRSGELKRVARGQYRYNLQAAPSREAEKITRMWRTLKTSKPGFSIQELARVSGAGYHHAAGYVRALEKAEYVRRAGKQGNTILYRATAKVRQQQHAFQPPKGLSDPFEVEKACLHELLGLFMQRDLQQPKVKQRVAELCQTILNRFEKHEEYA